MAQPKIWVIVAPRTQVKPLKDMLAKENILNKDMKITPSQDGTSRSIIPTTLEAFYSVTANYEAHLSKLVEVCKTQSGVKDDGVEIVALELVKRVRQRSRLFLALSYALRHLVEQSGSDMAPLPSVIPVAYDLYPPMLLLQSHAFADPEWRTFLASLGERAKKAFFTIVGDYMQATHIAINAPIPLQHSCLASATKAGTANVIRSPTHLAPIHGDFGPALPPFPVHSPTQADFDAAFWVCTKQNGITQVWAPRYTMFSSGNVTEKARILHLSSVSRAVIEARDTGSGCCAVDLYAGIGYFTFSYAKAGVNKVLAWDLNPWSIEGLRRGAALNKWRTSTIPEPKSNDMALPEDAYSTLPPLALDPATKLVAFPESNVHAAVRIRLLRPQLPPIRHVNCGGLPCLGAAVETAIEAVDPLLGGWVHFHQVVSEQELDDEVEDIVEQFRAHLDLLRLKTGGKDVAGPSEVVLEHVEQVKSVAPRKLHLVLDIWVKR